MSATMSATRMAIRKSVTDGRAYLRKDGLAGEGARNKTVFTLHNVFLVKGKLLRNHKLIFGQRMTTFNSKYSYMTPCVLEDRGAL